MTFFQPTVSTVSSDTQLEGTDLVHTVTMTGGSVTDETYTFTLVDNTTDSATDYSSAIFSDGVTYDSVSGLITVPAGVTTFTVTTATTDDLLDEDDEFYDLTIGGVSATGTIQDNDTVTVSTVTSDSQLEGTDLVHTVTMSGASATDETYTFTLVDNTTDSATDYSSAIFSDGVTYDSVSGLITVPAGVTTFTVTTGTTDDLLDEDDEFYDLTIGGVSATGTIQDNDTVTVSTVTSDSQLEGTDLVHTVTMSGASATDETYTFTLVDNTTDSATDYSSATFSDGVTYDSVSGLITVPAGVTTFTVTTATTDDLLDEDDEFYDLTIGGVSATGTISG